MDKVSELQQCVDQMALDMFNALRLLPPMNGLNEEETKEHVERIKGLAKDLLLTAKLTNEAIDALPGLEKTEEDQLEEMAKLQLASDEEARLLCEAEAEALRWNQCAQDSIRVICDTQELKIFLEPDVPVTSIASSIIARDAKTTKDASAPSCSEEFLQKLSIAMQQIDISIESYVSEAHLELLQQVGSVDGLKQHVHQLHGEVSDVKNALDRMDTDVQKVYDLLKRTVQQLRNVDTCTSIVQRVLRFQSLASLLDSVSQQILNSTTSNFNDDYYAACSKASLALFEAEALLRGDDAQQFQVLSIVQPHLLHIKKLRTYLVKQMKTFLKQGMTTTDQSLIASSLQVLFQLGLETFSESVQACVNEVLHDFETKCTSMLKESHLSTGIEDSGKVDAWIAAQNVIETLSSYTLQVWHLQRVLVKLGHQKMHYFDAVVEADEPSLLSTFWDISCALLRELFKKTMEYRASVKSVLIGHYPRLRLEAMRMLKAFVSTTSRLLDSSVRHRAMVLSFDVMENELLDAFAPILTKFQERSLERLLNPIQMMFPKSTGYHPSPPSRSDMQTLLKILASEVDAAGTDLPCVLMILSGVRRAVEQFCTNISAIVHTSSAILALPPSSTRTVAQAHNIALLALCHQLDDALVELPVIKSKKSDIAPAMTKSITLIRAPLEQLQTKILSGYLDILATRCEGIFASMHEESFVSNVSTDRFMVEFNSVFSVFLTDHFGRLGMDAVPCVQLCLDAFCTRLLSNLVRQISLVRPLNDAGKCRLTNDLAQIELLLGQVRPLSGLVYEEFRAIKHLLFVDTNRILRDGKLDKIRPSNIWHHVISRAVPELLLPHKAKGWSAAQYVKWMETEAGLELYSPPIAPSEMPLGIANWKDRTLALAAEQAIWKEVTATLDAYAQRNAAMGKSHVDPVYEILNESGVSLLAGYEVASKAYLYPIP
ncbi:oligomeric Golgi complex subunit 5 [Thraustotheca clavata]|uniref:Conserved oligomeric Golgi complex subunit 5 n=1 Tax=Thraustotheca clavata TaxID=74557 RepID=A0A1W0ACK0_9STRA|nr:oligomeric Golgi complex subunit 5 [Thraustotheca clavata]